MIPRLKGRIASGWIIGLLLFVCLSAIECQEAAQTADRRTATAQNPNGMSLVKVYKFYMQTFKIRIVRVFYSNNNQKVIMQPSILSKG